MASAGSDRMGSNRMGSDRAGSDRAGSDSGCGGRGGSGCAAAAPVSAAQSLLNSPNTALILACLGSRLARDLLTGRLSGV